MASRARSSVIGWTRVFRASGALSSLTRWRSAREILDANLLYPFHLSNLLVQMAVDAIIALRWTERTHEEWITNLVATRRVTRERLARTRDLIDDVLPDASVLGWEARMEGLTLPDPDDRHVLAVVSAAGATTILTMNLRDFPKAVLAPHGAAAAHPDAFLCALHDADPEVRRASAEAAQANLRVCQAVAEA